MNRRAICLTLVAPTLLAAWLLLRWFQFIEDLTGAQDNLKNLVVDKNDAEQVKEMEMNKVRASSSGIV